MEKTLNSGKKLSKDEQKKIPGGSGGSISCFSYENGHNCVYFVECDYDLPLCEPI